MTTVNLTNDLLKEIAEGYQAKKFNGKTVSITITDGTPTLSLTNKGDPNYTEVAVILDESGSMSPVHDDTIGGFNTLLKTQQETEGNVRLTLAKFDTEFAYIYNNESLHDLKSIDKSDYTPRGGTALLDAIGTTVADMEKRFAGMNADKRPGNILVTVMTDGGENCSKEWTRETVKALLERLTAEGWEFAFIGANQDAITTAKSYGFQAMNAANYGNNMNGIEAAFLGKSNAIGITRGILSSDDGSLYGSVAKANMEGTVDEK